MFASISTFQVKALTLSVTAQQNIFIVVLSFIILKCCNAECLHAVVLLIVILLLLRLGCNVVLNVFIQQLTFMLGRRYVECHQC
jgi:hypothetical protein